MRGARFWAFCLELDLKGGVLPAGGGATAAWKLASQSALSPGRVGPVFDKKTERLVCAPLPPVGLSFKVRRLLAVFHVV